MCPSRSVAKKSNSGKENSLQPKVIIQAGACVDSQITQEPKGQGDRTLKSLALSTPTDQVSSPPIVLTPKFATEPQSGTTWHGRNFLRATLRQDITRPRRGLRALLGG
jgi:hypothetical protein